MLKLHVFAPPLMMRYCEPRPEIIHAGRSDCRTLVRPNAGEAPRTLRLTLPAQQWRSRLRTRPLVSGERCREQGELPNTDLFRTSHNAPVNDEIRQIIKDHGRLQVDAASLSDDDDLYQAGMTSHASVNVMLALEDHFDVEFPDRLLERAVFESIGALAAALAELTEEAARAPQQPGDTSSSRSPVS